MTSSQKQSFRVWHEERMHELDYPDSLRAELRAVREKWLEAA